MPKPLGPPGRPGQDPCQLGYLHSLLDFSSACLVLEKDRTEEEVKRDREGESSYGSEAGEARLQNDVEWKKCKERKVDILFFVTEKYPVQTCIKK